MKLAAINMEQEEVLARGQPGYKFTNWATTFSCCPDLYFEPETIEDIRKVYS